MIRKIILTDFMAHAATEIELGPGLTVLTGPNNSGKSAVVEALRCLAVNPTPKYYIRHGAKEARVEIVFDDGARLAWVRREKYALYELTRPGAQEPEVYAKFGRKPPEEVQDVLRLSLVELEDSAEVREIDVHLGNQREPIFLLNKPKTVMASFFASTTESAHLIKMQALLKNRINKAKAEEKDLLARLAGFEGRLDRLSPLPDVCLRLERLRLGLDASLAGQRHAAALEDMVAAMTGTASTLARQLAAAGAYAALTPAPELFEVAPLRGLTLELSHKTGLRRQAQAKSEALSRLAAPHEHFDAAALATRLNALRTVAARECRAAALVRALTGLAPPPAARDTQALASVASRLAKLRRANRELTARQDLLSRIAPLPEPKPVAALASLAAALRTLAGKIDTATTQTAEAAANLDGLSLTITKRLRDIGACPLCGGQLDAEHFLGEFHHAGQGGAA
jgi:exonuclease SbcC